MSGDSAPHLQTLQIRCGMNANHLLARRGVYHLRGAIAQRGANLLYYAPLDIKSDSKESTNRALFSKD